MEDPKDCPTVARLLISLLLGWRIPNLRVDLKSPKKEINKMLCSKSENRFSHFFDLLQNVVFQIWMASKKWQKSGEDGMGDMSFFLSFIRSFSHFLFVRHQFLCWKKKKTYSRTNQGRPKPSAAKPSLLRVWGINLQTTLWSFSTTIKPRSRSHTFFL